MASLDQLPADQRAVLQLLLKQGRTYEGLSSMLRVDPEGVRERAHAALGALGPQTAALSPDRQEELSDYLLGQQPAAERAQTREFLAGSAAGRGWARVVADGLRPLSADRLPEIPDEGERDDGARPDDAIAAAAAAQPTPEERRAAHDDDPGRERDEAARSSRWGGILLLVGLGIALAVVVVVLVTGGDSDRAGGQQGQTTPRQQPQIIAQPNLFPPEGSDTKALGAGQILRQQNQLALRLVAQGLPPATAERGVYAIWLTNGADEGAELLGYPEQQPTQEQPLLAAQRGLPPQALQFSQVIITRESAQATATEPGEVVLQGRLLGDRQGQQPQGGGGQQPQGGSGQQPGG